MAGIILGEMKRRGRIWGRSVRVSRFAPWDAQVGGEQARRVIWLPGECQIWDSIGEMEEPASVGVTRDPKIHASTASERSVA